MSASERERTDLMLLYTKRQADASERISKSLDTLVLLLRAQERRAQDEEQAYSGYLASRESVKNGLLEELRFQEPKP